MSATGLTGAGNSEPSSVARQSLSSGRFLRSSWASSEKYSRVGPSPVPSSFRNSNSRTDC